MQTAIKSLYRNVNVSSINCIIIIGVIPLAAIYNKTFKLHLTLWWCNQVLVLNSNKFAISSGHLYWLSCAHSGEYWYRICDCEIYTNWLCMYAERNWLICKYTLWCIACVVYYYVNIIRYIKNTHTFDSFEKYTCNSDSENGNKLVIRLWATFSCIFERVIAGSEVDWFATFVILLKRSSANSRFT